MRREAWQEQSGLFHQHVEIIVGDLALVVGHLEELRVEHFKSLFGEVETEFAEPVLQAVATGSGGENDLALLRAVEVRVDDFIGGSLFEDAVLVDSRAVRVGIGPDDRLVPLHEHSGECADHA